jgi:anti-repressor protein
MNEMEVFRFEGSQVRTVFNEGQMWWVAKDVCEVLGLKKPENSYSKIDIEDRAVTLIEGDSQRREMATVNESGLYALIFQSNTDSSKR